MILVCYNVLSYVKNVFSVLPVYVCLPTTAGDVIGMTFLIVYSPAAPSICVLAVSVFAFTSTAVIILDFQQSLARALPWDMSAGFVIKFCQHS